MGVEENTNKVRAIDPGTTLASMLNATGNGSSLFVINLCASMAPVDNIGKTLPGLESYRLYQMARREDGRTRYRLRLGFFSSESDAEAVLSKVRASYPTAFTTCLCEEDRKFTRGYVSDTAAATAAPAPKKPLVVVVENKPSAEAPVTPTPATVRATTAGAPVAKPASAPPKPSPQANSPAAAASISVPRPAARTAMPSAPSQAKTNPPKQSIDTPSKLMASIELSLESEPAAAKPAPTHSPSDAPFHVAKGVDVPATALTLETESPAPAPRRGSTKAGTPPAPPERSNAPAKAARETAGRPLAAPAFSKPASPPSIRKLEGPLPDLDSTQTIRALTSAELEDDSQEKWFAIQLAVSDQPVNLDAMPHLDIFEAYRLYSVANAANGRITHYLRLGFFREEISADAVAGYLRTFFAEPGVVRISIAEQARFNDRPGKPAAPKQDAKILELSQLRERTSKPVPTITMALEEPGSGKFDAGATSAFKPSSTGAHASSSATGVHKALSTGTYSSLSSTGTHNAASKTSAPATKRSAPISSSATGKHKALSKKSLSEELLEEARQVELAQSGIRKLPKSPSLIAKMFGKLTK